MNCRNILPSPDKPEKYLKTNPCLIIFSFIISFSVNSAGCRPYKANQCSNTGANMTNIIEIKNISYQYADGKSVLADINFRLAEGESLALIGANGAGKSTLLLLLAAVLQPTNGEIICQGQFINKKNQALLRQTAGLIFQQADNQLFCNSVYEDVIFGPLNMGLTPPEAGERAKKIIALLDIEHLASRPPYRLSAGEKRLVSIATVLAMQPQLLLMDEPSAELDPRARRHLIELLNSLPQAKIIATHDLDLAQKTCDRAILLYEGRIVADGLAEDILGDKNLLLKHGL
jgi:cobalt/nickel transport system ATP-binding protein